MVEKVVCNCSVMTLSLKLDQRTTRGKALQNVLNEYSMSKTKAAMHDNKCSSCNETVLSDYSVKCCKCKVRYHTQCLTISLPSDFADLLNTNLCIWWCCISCLMQSNKEVDDESTTTPEVDGHSDYQVDFMNVISEK